MLRRDPRQIALAMLLVWAATAPAAAQDALPPAIAAITGKPAYASSTWGLAVLDAASGAELLSHAADKMFVPGSVMKIYSSGTALEVYGPDHRFETAVYRRGAVEAGVLRGELVLVASGDFSLGLRDRPDGTLAFNSAPELDHNYADTGLPGAALVPGSRPLAGLEDLAAQVRAAGIREARDVIIDDRLFTTYRGWPDGVIAPIWVNENVIDIVTTPTAPGAAATVDWRPRTAAYRMVSEVRTVAGDGAPLTVDSPRAGVIRVRGQIGASSRPVVNIWPVEDPASFARTAFVEALGRAGVTVKARATGANPAGRLPAASAYPASERVARRASPPLSQYTKVILKTSYNRGADLMLCLVAVRAGQRDCVAGLTRAVALMAKSGVSPLSTIVFDGAGSDERERTSPADLARYLRAIGTTPWGAALRRDLAVLGVDGDLAKSQVGASVAGKVQAKTGARVAMAPDERQGIATALAMAGYAVTASGREVVFAIMLRDLAFKGLAELFAAREDQAAIAAAIQTSY